MVGRSDVSDRSDLLLLYPGPGDLPRLRSRRADVLDGRTNVVNQGPGGATSRAFFVSATTERHPPHRKGRSDATQRHDGPAAPLAPTEAAPPFHEHERP